MMNVLTGLMLLVLVLFLALYRTMKPSTVHLSSEHSSSDEGTLDVCEAPVVKAVKYCRDSDQVLLLADMDFEDQDGDGGVDATTEKT